MVKPDAQGSKPCITRRNLLRGGVALVGLGTANAVLQPLAVLAAPGDRYDVVTVGTFENDVPLQGIFIRAEDILLKHATNVEVTGELSFGDVTIHESSTYRAQAVTVPVEALSERDVEGTFKALIENAAIDSDGERLDMELFLHDVHLGVCPERYQEGDVMSIFASPDPDYVIPPTADGETLRHTTYFQSYSLRDWPGSASPVRQTLRVRFLRHGTQELAHGKLNYVMRDVDICDLRVAAFAEGFRLVSGFDRKIYVSMDTTLNVDTATGLISARGPQADDTPAVMAIAVAEPEFEVAWQGYWCASWAFSTWDQAPINIPVKKIWDGAGYDKFWPGSVTVRLFANDEEVSSLSLSNDNGWAGAFEELPVVDSALQPIAYTVREDEVAHFTAKVTGDTAVGFTVTNTLIVPNYTNITVRKVWTGEGAADALPDELVVHVVGTDGSDRPVTLNKANHWQATIDELPQIDARGEWITYTLDERDVPDGFRLVSVDGDVESGWTVTNEYQKGSGGLTKEASEKSWL